MRPKHWIMLAVLSVLWGLTFVFAKGALVYLPPLTLTLVRVATATAALLPFVHLLGYRLPARASEWRDFAVMAALNNIIPFGLIFWGQTRIPSGLAAVMNATTPLMTLLVARFVAGESLARHKISGLVLGVVGVGILVGPAALRGEGGAAFGMTLVMGGTLSYGLSALWGRRFSKTQPIVSATTQLLCATVALVPMAALVDRFWTLPVPPVEVLWSLAALGLLSTALAYVLFFRIMAEAGSNNVMLVTLLIPISAIVIGALVLHEALTPNQLAGAAVIALSLIVIDGRLLGGAREKPSA